MANDVTEKKTLEGEFENFFIKTKYLWIALICAVVVALIVICSVLAISSASSKKASNFLEDAIYKYETSLAKNSVDDQLDIENEFVSTLENYVSSKGKNKNTIRVYMTLAKVYMNREDWQKAAKCEKNTYLAGIADFNAGVCFEQIGNLEDAELCYKKASENKNFHLVPHALFSEARVLETLGKSEDAKSVYEKIINTYSDDEWASLAKSRIIFLNSRVLIDNESALEN